MKERDNMEMTIHKFEIAGLGKAPFAVVGFEVRKFQACQGAPIQPGASCRFCGRGIQNVFLIKSSDGKIFPVGSECVEKTDDSWLTQSVDKMKSRNRRESANAKCADLTARAKDALQSKAVRSALDAKPHPHGRAGATLLSYLEWCLTNAGRAGRTKAAKVILEVTVSPRQPLTP